MKTGDLQELMARLLALELRVTQLEGRQQPVTGFTLQPRYNTRDTTGAVRIYDNDAETPF